jgi:hypothetical protein
MGKYNRLICSSWVLWTMFDNWNKNDISMCVDDIFKTSMLRENDKINYYRNIFYTSVEVMYVYIVCMYNIVPRAVTKNSIRESRNTTDNSK